MAYKLILILLLFLETAFSNIIYDKNNNSITELELNTYIELYKNSFNQNINKNKALKDIILIKNTINFLEKNNPDFVLELDEILKSQFKNIKFETSIIKDYLRFQKIRNEFISDYFQNQFDIEDLKTIFSSMNELEFPISKNNCLTIEKIHKFNEDEFFLNNFYENFKEGNTIFKAKIKNDLFDVCVTNNQIKEIEKEIIRFVEIKTQSDFQKFIYGKLN
tara:strand:- start:3110 stop:3769 length:660 start_codon:yes stop_codon:yes gene_type:complete